MACIGRDGDGAALFRMASYRVVFPTGNARKCVGTGGEGGTPAVRVGAAAPALSGRKMADERLFHGLKSKFWGTQISAVPNYLGFLLTQHTAHGSHTGTNSFLLLA